MGSYGIGIERIVACHIEQNHDANGIIWDKALAPFDLQLIAVAMKSQAVADAPGGPGRIYRVINDLNGERWRFLEWALACNPALSALPPDFRLWHPADCFGDIGAATGAAHICLAVRAFARDYAVGDAILIANTSDTGERAALCVYPEPRRV